jgi:outer membrane protein OmpA-like peptidoglycan-associated protein
MRHSLRAPRASRAALAGLLLLLVTGSGRAETCAAMIDTFNRLLDSGRPQDAEAQIDRLQHESSCAGYIVPAQRRLAAHRLAAAQKAMGEDPPTESAIVLVERADRPGVLWQAAATIAEIRFVQRRFHEAAQKFDQAIEIVKNETYTPKEPSRAEIEGLLDRAAQARLLAANGELQSADAGFVETISQTRDGTLGGIYSPRVRGITPRVVPTPITFDYRSATLTPQGEQAARELARAIKEQRPERVTLIGHTDVRGSADYNKKLSISRAEAVASFLRENEVDVAVEAEGVGAAEPLQLKPAPGLTEDDIYALNRRVEWRRE